MYVVLLRFSANKALAADTVIFLHTGGLPATFAYRDAILAIS